MKRKDFDTDYTNFRGLFFESVSIREIRVEA